MTQCNQHKRYNKKCYNCQTLRAIEDFRNKNITSKTRIVVSLRQLWLRSRERATALKRDAYTCTVCNRKQSTAKGKEFRVQVHHINGIEWDDIIEFVRKRLLIHESGLKCVCKECHKLEHSKEVNNNETTTTKQIQ